MTNKRTRKGTMMNVEIAQRLAELRRAQGLSQEDLANKLGLSRQAVSKWERAESAPDMGNLIALADLYEVTIDELLRVSPEVEENVRYELQECVKSTEEQTKNAAETAENKSREVAECSQAAASVPETPTATSVPKTAAASVAYPAGVQVKPPKSPLRTFPYPLVCVVVYLIMGFCFGWWHPGWIIFLTIPFYYWIVSVIERDQQWQADHSNESRENSGDAGFRPHA
ncbi:helix-turn-helix domain-containing protein [Adlercreutzia sp. ZJ138]|uniref:helix-turn-helix domain-containing protein n=1 Tax=Adlercreutzia sp. ZJ138 TaxID=2709405 RepID=UPI001F1564F0|nr:helix-turn-helix domain-containing protein [Adlercreutzia sp. ZJ138]